MRERTLLAAVLGVAIVAAIAGGILLSTRKNRVQLTGEFLKVRSYQMDPEHTIALIDVRVHNPSTQQFMVKEVEVFVEEPGGRKSQGEMFSETDARRVTAFYPVLGSKDNPGLLRRDRIASGEKVDRTLAVSVPMTDERFQKRTGLLVSVLDADGARIEMAERR